MHSFEIVSESGVLWDMDGVLVDTGEFHFRAWSQALSEYGIPFNRELFRTTFGMNNTGILSVLLEQTPPPELVAEISDRKEWLFRQAVRGRAQPLPGVRGWLEDLKAARVRQAVASSAPPADLGQALKFDRLKGASHRVVWVAEQKKRGAPGICVKDCPLKTIEVMFVPPVFLDQRHDFADAPVISRCGEHWPIDRGLHEHLIARCTDGVTDQVESSHHAGEEEYLVRLDAPAVQPGQTLLNHLAEDVW